MKIIYIDEWYYDENIRMYINEVTKEQVTKEDFESNLLIG